MRSPFTRLTTRSTRRNGYRCGSAARIFAMSSSGCSTSTSTRGTYRRFRLCLRPAALLQLLHPLFELAHLPQQLRHLRQRHRHPQPLAMGHRRIPGVRLAIRNVVRDARLRPDSRAVADAQVSHDSRLSGEDRALADLRRPGDADLGDDEGQSADPDVVRNLDQVVDLRPASDDSLAQGGAIDARAGAELHVVLDASDAGLRHLAMHRSVAIALDVEGESESVRSDHGVGLQDDAIAEDAPLAHDGAAVEDAAAPHSRLVQDPRAGVEDGARSNARAPSDDGKGPDRRGRIDLCSGGNGRARVDPRGRPLLGVEQAARPGESDVGLRGDQFRRGGRRVLRLVIGENDRAGAGGGKLLPVARVRVEGDVLRAGLVERTDAAHTAGSVAAHFGADARRQLCEAERPLRHYFFPVAADFGGGLAFPFGGDFGAAVFSAPRPNLSLYRRTTSLVRSAACGPYRRVALSITNPIDSRSAISATTWLSFCRMLAIACCSFPARSSCSSLALLRVSMRSFWNSSCFFFFASSESTACCLSYSCCIFSRSWLFLSICERRCSNSVLRRLRAALPSSVSWMARWTSTYPNFCARAAKADAETARSEAANRVRRICLYSPEAKSSGS